VRKASNVGTGTLSGPRSALMIARW
jgi:hypothetical protein